MTRKFLIVLACLGAGAALRQTSAWAFSGTEGASFLELPVGARPAAMGSAYTMLAEDAYAPVWNPAGLAFLDGPQFAGMHMLYLESTSYEFGSFVYPLGKGRGLGASIQYFRPGAVVGMDQTGNPIGEVNGSYGNYTMAFAQSFGSTFGLGVSGSVVHGQIDGLSGHAFSGGGGFLYRPSPEWRFAATVANAGQKLSLLSEADSLPLTYRAGGAYHPNASWTLALEAAKQNDGLTSGHAGVEYETPFGFTIRTGYNTERTRQLSAMAGISFGVSLLLWNQDFGYTWLPIGDLGSSHLLSLVWHFGQERKNSEDSKHLQRPPKREDMDFTLDN